MRGTDLRPSPPRLRRQGLQQAAIALDRLTDMQAPLNFPDAGGNRLHDRNAEILFEHRDDTKRVQGRSQDVDGIRARVFEKLLLDE
jgi:hypothetical protein